MVRFLVVFFRARKMLGGNDWKIEKRGNVWGQQRPRSSCFGLNNHAMNIHKQSILHRRPFRTSGSHAPDRKVQQRRRDRTSNQEAR